MSERRGSASVRVLVALLVILSLLPLAVTVFRFTAALDFDYDTVNSEMALMDLRRVLLLAYDLEVTDHELDFIYHNDDYSLKVVNGKLLLQPGSQIYLNDIDEVNFYRKNGCIYLSYKEKNGKEIERNIAKEKGIHLDDFSADNDELPDADHGDE